jgi:2,3-bisphosphoglycerate-dependent phosphoglycerate mutase
LNPTDPDPPLSVAGEGRSQRLADVFGQGPKGLSIDAIFVTQWARTHATATPLAQRLAVPVIEVKDDDLEGLEQRILRDFRGRHVLVVAHSDTVPTIVGRLGRVASVPAIQPDEYGTTYLIAIPRWSRPTVLRVVLP